MTKPRLVIVTDIAFWFPGVGSHRRIEQICETFSRFFNVEVFVFKTLSRVAIEILRKKRYSFNVVSYKDYEKKFTGKLRTTKEDIHPTLQKWYARSWHEAFHYYMEQKKPSVVVTEYLRMQYLIREIGRDVVTILDSHDIISLRSISFYSFGEHSTTHLSLDEEVELMNSYDFVLAISRPDYAWLTQFIRPSSAVFLPFIPSIEPLEPPQGKLRKRLIFAGANSPANAFALQWFVGQIFPYLPKDISLSVYGEVGKSITSDDRLHIHGIVEDVAEIYKEFGIAINPVAFGGGLKIKSLEALWAGLPLVTSAEGARGLEQFLGTGLYIAYSRQEFFDHICTASRTAYSAKAFLGQRANILASYQEEAAAEPFMIALQQLASHAACWISPAKRNLA